MRQVIKIHETTSMKRKEIETPPLQHAFLFVPQEKYSKLLDTRGCERPSQWHAFAFDLGDPICRTVRGLVTLVVLIKRAAKKLSA